MGTEPLRDEVDELVAAWRRERTNLDVAPLEVLSRVSRLAHYLDRQRRTAFAGHGLEPWEFDVLAALRRSGAPYQLTPGQLLRETLVTSGTMTNRVDRLAERELVLRENHPGDGRGVLVRLTDAGRTRVDAAFEELLAAEHAMLAEVPGAEREHLSRLLRRLLTAYEVGRTTGSGDPGGR